MRIAARLLPTLLLTAVGCREAQVNDGDLVQLEILRSEACRRLMLGPTDDVECPTADDDWVVRVRAAIVAGRIVIDDAAFDACMADDGAITFEDVLNPPREEPPCARVFAGTVDAGSACAIDFECADDGFCRRYADGGPLAELAGCGMCEPRRELGATCSVGRECQTRACIDGRCDAGDPGLPGAAGPGEPCASVGCLAGLDCVAEAPGEPAICTPNRRYGEYCTDASQCTARLTCSDERLCVVAFEGSACATDSNCPIGLVCAGVCVVEVARGAACSRDAECPDDHACIEGVCGRWLGAGQHCAFPDLCPPAMPCTDGTCRWLPLHGEPCADHCARGSCVKGRCDDLPEGAACIIDPIFGDACGMVTTHCASSTCAPIESLPGEACDPSTSVPWGFRCSQAEAEPGMTGRTSPICTL